MGIRSSRCPDSGHQKQMSGERGYSYLANVATYLVTILARR